MDTAREGMPSSVAILGSTGSVGRQALEVARYHGLRVDCLAACHAVAKLEEQIREFHPRFCAVADPHAAADLAARVADTGTRVLRGAEGIEEAISRTDAPVVVNAVLGEAGLRPTLAVIAAGKRLALANKESLVIAGEEVMRRVRETGVALIPVDSEHSAIFQCLQAGRAGEIKRLLLTASGGPFFGYDRARLARVDRAATLAHPTWQMGAKITVDSATLMNKGFELIEAAWLFGVPPQDITVVVQRQSIIHSMVEYIDNTVIAQMSVPDMRDCVQYALTWPGRAPGLTPPLDLFALRALTMEEPDEETFRLLPLARRALALGGGVPGVLNAVNEEAVAAFLADRISLLALMETVEEMTEAFAPQAAPLHTLEDILAVAGQARTCTKEKLAARALL